MLKNEDLKRINSAITLLTTIKLYLLENDPTNFIDKTGVDLIDIQHNIKNLITIHTQETMKHLKASEKSISSAEITCLSPSFTQKYAFVPLLKS